MSGYSLRTEPHQNPGAPPAPHPGPRNEASERRWQHVSLLGHMEGFLGKVFAGHAP